MYFHNNNGAAIRFGLSDRGFPTIFAVVGRIAAADLTPPSRKYRREKTTVSADPLPGAVSAGGRVFDRRLCALSALSRGRVLDRGAGLRCRPADAVVQDPDPGDRPVQEFGVRRGCAGDRGTSLDPAVDRLA